MGAEEEAKEAETQQPDVPVAAPAVKTTHQLISTEDLSVEQVRTTLQLINKMLRKQAQPTELAALLKIKEVREILDLHKVNPKESSERIQQYQKDLAARLRAHDRSKRGVGDDQPPASVEDGGAATTISKKARLEESVAKSSGSVEEAEPPKPPQKAVHRPRKILTGILSQSELAVPPTSLPDSKEFNVEWIQYFFQLMCSRIPFFSDSKVLLSGPSRTYVEESEDQRVFVDGLSSTEIVLLLNFVFDLESNLRASNAKGSVIVPNNAWYIHSMGDPLDSGLLEAWYFSSQAQCATCALRFANRKLLTIHHDYHFHKYTVGQRRRRGLENNFRGWMETPQEFIGSKELPFGFELYDKLDSMLNDSSSQSFFASIGLAGPDRSVEKGDDNVEIMKDSSSIVGNRTESHTARTVTARQIISENLLPDSVPVDEIMDRCMECGEAFEKQWIGENVDMAVFTNALAVAVGGSSPLIFHWPIKTAASSGSAQDVEEEEPEEKLQDYKIDASNASLDHRFVNALLFHKSCFAANEKLKTREYHMKLLSETCQVGISSLRPPPEAAEPVVLEEIDEDVAEMTSD